MENHPKNQQTSEYDGVLSSEEKSREMEKEIRKGDNKEKWRQKNGVVIIK